MCLRSLSTRGPTLRTSQLIDTSFVNIPTELLLLLASLLFDPFEACQLVAFASTCLALKAVTRSEVKKLRCLHAPTLRVKTKHPKYKELKAMFLEVQGLRNAGATALSMLLKSSAVLKYLNLTSNFIGDAGATALADALGVKAVLNHLYLGLNFIGPAGATALGEALKVNAALTTLNLNTNRLTNYGTDMSGVLTIAEALRANASLTEVDVRGNQISGKGALQLAAAVHANPKMEKFNVIPIKEMRADSLTALDLGYKNIGVEGGLVVAGLMPVMASLTEVRQLRSCASKVALVSASCAVHRWTSATTISTWNVGAPSSTLCATTRRTKSPSGTSSTRASTRPSPSRWRRTWPSATH